MKAIRVILGASWLAAAATLGAQTLLTRTFDEDKGTGVPAGFTLAAMRQPDPGRWALRRQGAETSLTHAATAGAAGFAIAVADASAIQDLSATVRLRLAGGARSGGVVWRYRDAQNFYAAILNLTRGTLAGYRVTDGNMIRIEGMFEDDLELDPNAWHTLKIVHDGAQMSVSLGGIRVFEENDRRDRIRSGLVGLIATGDSDVWFDDLRVEVRRPRR
jgi:hypothetical protein